MNEAALIGPASDLGQSRAEVQTLAYNTSPCVMWQHCCRWQCRSEAEADLLVTVHEVHEAVVVVVVVRALGRVDGQQQVVGPPGGGAACQRS